MLRSLRLVDHEQQSLADLQSVASHPIETILRCQAANARQLDLAVKLLAGLQERRVTMNSPSSRTRAVTCIEIQTSEAEKEGDEENIKELNDEEESNIIGVGETAEGKNSGG